VTWVMWNLLSVHLVIVFVSVQDNYMVCAERTKGLEIIWTHMMELLGDVCHVESSFGPVGDCVNVSPFGDSANLDAR
jgi:hypothetical protein